MIYQHQLSNNCAANLIWFVVARCRANYASILRIGGEGSLNNIVWSPWSSQLRIHIDQDKSLKTFTAHNASKPMTTTGTEHLWCGTWNRWNRLGQPN
jgi:hypothetical protein